MATCAMEDENPDTECSICQGQLWEPVMVACNAPHYFCFDCIARTYLEVDRTKTRACPLCRGGDGTLVLMERMHLMLQEHRTPEKRREICGNDSGERQFNYKKYRDAQAFLSRVSPYLFGMDDVMRNAGVVIVSNLQMETFARNIDNIDRCIEIRRAEDSTALNRIVGSLTWKVRRGLRYMPVVEQDDDEDEDGEEEEVQTADITLPQLLGLLMGATVPAAGTANDAAQNQNAVAQDMISAMQRAMAAAMAAQQQQNNRPDGPANS